MKRTAIGIAAVIMSLVALSLIDWGTSFLGVGPCVIQRIDGCAYHGGAFVAAISAATEWKPETWTALGTVVIAIFTTVLGVFTVSVANSTRIAAKAAELSARAAIAIELPLIRARAGQLGYGVSQNGPGPQRYACYVDKLLFSNLGKTRAFPIEVQFGWTVGNKLPKAPIYPFTKSLPTNAILEVDPKTAGEVWLKEFDFETSSDLYDRLRTRKTSLWFYCNLIYSDFMQTRHEAGFCWKQHETTGMGILRDDPTPAYNKKT
jgi:hypothetical protein